MKIKFPKHKKTFKHEAFYKNPNIMWKMFLLLMLFSVSICFVFGYLLFSKVNKGFSVDDVAQVEQVEKVKKDRIEKVLEFFVLRREKSAGILNSPAPVVDPSL